MKVFEGKVLFTADQITEIDGSLSDTSYGVMCYMKVYKLWIWVSAVEVSKMLEW